MPISLLGVNISTINKPELLRHVEGRLAGQGQTVIFSINPEILVKAQKDSSFKEVLNKGDINICDGRGAQFASKEKLIRITGVDLMQDICKLASEKSLSIYLLGSEDTEVVEKTANNLKRKFPKLIIAGTDPGTEVGATGEGGEEMVEGIKAANPDILFVAFGMVKQEKWIHKNLSKLSTVKLAMGVGGSFDFISGKIKRAPLLFRKIGVEWLYRLWKEPKRILRILNALVVFPFYIIKSKFSND